MTDRPKVQIEPETWEDIYYLYDLNAQKLYNHTALTKQEAEEAVAFELESNPDSQWDILQAVKWDTK